MATQPPSRKTSGARPLMARGAARGSADISVLPAGAIVLAGLGFEGLPGIAPIDLHPDIAARARGAAETHLGPGCGMSVVSRDSVQHQPMLEEHLRRHSAPGAAG